MSLLTSQHPGAKHHRYSRYYWQLTAVVIAALFSLPALADHIRLGADFPYSVLDDRDGQLAFEDAERKLRDAPLTERGTFSRGYVRNTYWLRFEIPASVFHDEERWLTLGPNFVDDIRIFYRPKDSNGDWSSLLAGDLIARESAFDYRQSTFRLPPPASGFAGYEVIARVQSSSTTILQAGLWKPTDLFNHATKSTSFWSFYLGLSTASTLLVIVLVTMLGGRLLWAALAFSSSYLFVAAVQGYISWFSPFSTIPLQHYLTSILTLTSYASLLWLCAEAVNLRDCLPRIYRVLTAASALILSLTLLIPMDQYGTAIKIQTVIYGFAAVTFIYAVVVLSWRSLFKAKTVLLALCPLICIIGSMSGMFSALGLVPFRSEIYVIWQYALITIMFLVMGLAVYRIREKKLEEYEKKQLANELKAERDASFHQRQFMGMVAHEFRTPLAVIAGSLQNLKALETDENTQRLQRFERIQRANERLVQLTDNCLADARVAASDLYLEPSPADLLDTIRYAATLVQLSDSHELVLTFSGKSPKCQNDKTCILNFDSAMIRIALSNVIDNAVKHSKKGRIQVDLSFRDEQPVIRVSDEGPGIETEDQNMIFERYRRGTHSRSGTGLGLYIARQICRSHGGGLVLVGSSNQGSCFELTFKPS